MPLVILPTWENHKKEKARKVTNKTGGPHHGGQKATKHGKATGAGIKVVVATALDLEPVMENPWLRATMKRSTRSHLLVKLSKCRRVCGNANNRKIGKIGKNGTEWM